MKTRTISTLNQLAWACALALGSAAAAAAPCTGISVGSASTGDVTLAGAASDQCVISNVNPQQGASGNTSGFSGTFGTGWTMLGKVDINGAVTGQPASVGGVVFDIDFMQATGTAGTWSVTTDKAATFDLVFAMHGANRSGAFLFDNEATSANLNADGTWAIHWLNNGGNVPNYSNLTVFVRDVALAPVPEPETYALMLAGLGAVGFVARRRQA
ncbi:hypothetical protein BH11PSE9_BH11PSE9_12390 [soil metagenome]